MEYWIERVITHKMSVRENQLLSDNYFEGRSSLLIRFFSYHFFSALFLLMRVYIIKYEVVCHYCIIKSEIFIWLFYTLQHIPVQLNIVSIRNVF